MAAQNGTFTFAGARENYTVSAYFDDTAGNRVLLNQAGKAAAGSPNKWNPPENVVLVDMCIAQATGQTTTQLLRNSTPTGDYPLNALHLAAITTRPVLRKVYQVGSEFAAIQIA